MTTTEQTAAEITAGVANNVIQPPADSPLPVGPQNVTAKADPAKAPKPTEGKAQEKKSAVKARAEVVEARIAKATGKAADKAPAKKAASVDDHKAEAKKRAETVDKEKQAEFDKVVKLIDQGLRLPEIAAKAGITYGRAKVLVWFRQYVGAAPGCAGYTSEKRAAGQAKYEADVARRKEEKAKATAKEAGKANGKKG